MAVVGIFQKLTRLCIYVFAVYVAHNISGDVHKFRPFEGDIVYRVLGFAWHSILRFE
jgi:hypothetical protein